MVVFRITFDTVVKSNAKIRISPKNRWSIKKVKQIM